MAVPINPATIYKGYKIAKGGVKLFKALFGKGKDKKPKPIPRRRMRRTSAAKSTPFNPFPHKSKMLNPLTKLRVPPISDEDTSKSYNRKKAASKVVSAETAPEADTGADSTQAGPQEHIATPYSGIRKRRKRPIYERKKFSTPKRKRYGNGGNGSTIPEGYLWG